MQRFAPVFLVALLLLGAGNAKLKRLSEVEFDHYQALKVWMDKQDRKAYLKLKTEDARNQWLKDQGLWERFYQYDKPEREEILAGNVEVGWSHDKVLMAFGKPHERQRLTGRNAARSELATYRFEVTPEGEVLVWTADSKHTHNAVRFFRLEIILDDARVAKVQKLDSWK
jgi:hypothetical protein